jgi:hypothetical protein
VLVRPVLGSEKVSWRLHFLSTPRLVDLYTCGCFVLPSGRQPLIRVVLVFSDSGGSVIEYNQVPLRWLSGIWRLVISLGYPSVGMPSAVVSVVEMVP